MKFEKDIDITEKPEQKTLDVLLEEYNGLITQINTAVSQFNVFSTGLITAIGAVIGLDVSNRIENINLVAFIPILLMLLGGVTIYLLFRTTIFSLQARLVVTRIIELTKQPEIDMFYHKNSIPSRFQSLKRGKSYKIFILSIFCTVLIIVSIAIVRIVLMIHQKDHLLGLFISIILLTLLAMYLSAFISILVELPKMYDCLLQDIENKSKPDRESTIDLTINFRILLPRTIDFFTKSLQFFSGVLAAIIFSGISYYNPRIYDLFTNKPIGSLLPSWTVFAFSLIWYIDQEFFTQQAKYLWNDLRDSDRDRRTGGKEDRVIVSNNFPPQLIACLIILRFGMGITIGFLLDYRLGIINLIITFLQIIYEFGVKPKTNKLPAIIIATIIMALGSMIRFISGALSITNQISLQTIILSSVFFYQGVGYIAKYWKVEAEHVRDENRNYPPRPQSDFFLNHGQNWQHFGFISMLISSVLLIFIGIMQHNNIRLISSWNLTLVNLNPFSMEIVAIILVIFVVFLIASALYKPISKVLIAVDSKVILLIIFITNLMLLALGQLEIIPSLRAESFIVGGIFIFLAILSFYTYEKMTYDQFLLNLLKRNIRKIGKLWFSYIFNSNCGFSFSELLKVSILLVNYDEEEVRKILDF